MVHRREIDGEELLLGNQGDLYLRAMTWWDHRTGSVWSQPRGEAILGPLQGQRLELLSSTLSDWGTWRRDHPETLALDAEGGGAGFAVDDTVLVVEVGPQPIAYDVRDVQAAGGVVNDTLGELPIAVVVDPGNAAAWRVFARDVGGTTLELEFAAERLRDVVTGTAFHPTLGTNEGGPVAGDLDPLPAFTSFPDDYHNHFPDGRTWSPPGG